MVLQRNSSLDLGYQSGDLSLFPLAKDTRSQLYDARNNAETTLKQTLTYPVEPELQFQPDAQAPYDTTIQVLNIIKGSGVTAFGFVGNEQYAVFGKAANAGKAGAN